MDEQQVQAADVEEQKKEQVETPLESVSSICTVLAVGLFLMTFVFQNYVIPSGSMEKTLHGCTPGCNDDRVLVDKLSYKLHGIHRHDVVVEFVVGWNLDEFHRPVTPVIQRLDPQARAPLVADTIEIVIEHAVAL